SNREAGGALPPARLGRPRPAPQCADARVAAVMRRDRIHDAAFSAPLDAAATRDGRGFLPPSPDGSATVAPSPSAAPIAGDRILRPREVFVRVGLSRTTIWRLVRNGAFPAPRRLSANAVGWRASEVDAWIASRTPTHPSVGGAS